MKPTIGRIVIYVNSGGYSFPAIIVKVGSFNAVNIRVFNDSQVIGWFHGIRHDEDKNLNTWHWPEKI